MENERKKMNDVIDGFLDMMGGEDGPIDFQIMKYNRDNSKVFMNIMTKNEFLKLDDQNEIKQALLKFQKESNKFLKEIQEKIENM